MIDWLANHGGMLVLMMFFILFLAFSLWAYLPANKTKMRAYGHIPLKEEDNGKQ
jgi:cbb3-type cytochrome oxidase subunit 3